MRRDGVLANLAVHREEIAAVGVSSLSLFGSVARDEGGPESDIDLLVELDSSVGLFTVARVQLYLVDLLGRPVDLVMADALKRRLRAAILSETVRAA